MEIGGSQQLLCVPVEPDYDVRCEADQNWFNRSCWRSVEHVRAPTLGLVPVALIFSLVFAAHLFSEQALLQLNDML